ncbi:methylated-DNA--[protein]-cysteine S-methyltransferase [Enterovirga sp. GCM10030262]|uniref:methylated-DNA--[protein]-cysteine S-methyltransferase n=1 Tax=Enterovirga sp. GCM10030262 TaxID=3273391 RepID=UPI00360EC420
MAGHAPAFALFDTPIGRCAIVWRGSAVIGVCLPEASDSELRQRIGRRFPTGSEGEPPATIAAAIDAIQGLLSGGRADLGFIEVDLSRAAPFERQVYEAAAAIPHGQVRTYGQIASATGAPGAARAVGRALGRNPVPIIVPCHRIVAAEGKSGGFSAPGGLATKFRILEIEGARRHGEPELFEQLPWAAKPAANRREAPTGPSTPVR